MGNQFKSVAMIVCIKTLLLVFNTVFWCCGIILMICGVWTEFELSKYLELPIDFSDTILYVIIGIGGLIVLICSLGCSCIIKGQSILLYVYGGVLAVILVLQLGVEISIYAYKHKLSEGFDRGLNQSLINYNTGNGVKSADFDLMQSSLHCCGVHNYSDWLQLVPAHPIPLSCCKVETNCITKNTENIYTEGCYTIIMSFMGEHINLIFSIVIGFTLFPLIGLILSCCLANQIKKANYDVIA